MGGDSSRHSDTSSGQPSIDIPLPRPQTPEEQDFLISVAQKFSLTRREVDVIWRRYQWLRPGDTGLINTSVFNQTPFSDDWFLERVARSLRVEEGGQTIRFDAFVYAVKHWKESNVEEKLKAVFRVLGGGQCLNPDMIHELLLQLRPTENRDILKQSAESLVNAMGSTAGQISEEDFVQWLLQLGPERLEPLLNFSLTGRNSTDTQADGSSRRPRTE